MATQLSLLLPLIAAVATTASVTSPAASPAAATAPSDFLRTSCNATLYPDVCYTSLSRYANTVQRDPAHLAMVAIGVSLARAHRTSAYISNLTRQVDYAPNPRATAALHDCSSTFGDAVDQMRRSLRQMRRLGSGTQGMLFQLSNVQTWMSAALTNENTCSDGFADVADCPIKAGVCDRVGTVTKLTSNALALVNSFANSVGPDN